MKRLTNTFFFLFLVFNGFSQDSTKFASDILTTSKLEKGVYTDYIQFKSNSPSVKKEFYFDKRTSNQIWAWGGTELELKFTDKNIKKSYINNTIWGVCNGDSIFINNKLISINKGYNKLLKLDFPLSYFVAYIVMRDEDVDRATLIGSFGAIGGASAAIPYKRVVAIDMRTGELIRMNGYGFQKLFKDDNELMNKYNQIKDQDNNEQLIFQILDEYNIKNKK